MKTAKAKNKAMHKAVYNSAQAGFSLAITLFFAGAVAGILTAIVYSTSQKATIGKSDATGWQVAEIARAARVFVRDQNANDTAGYTTSDLAPSGAGPREVTMADIKAAGLLPDSYAEQTALGQTIRIIAANFPVRGNPLDNATLPAAYIYITDNGRTSAITANIVAEGARRHGLSISSPRFDGAGNNVSADCGAAGDPSFSIWDTGCLNEDDFNVLVSILPGAEQTFVAGSLLIPSWRSIQHDSRAVMRYPQQENTGFNQMQVDLAMGTVDRNIDGSCASFQQINTGDAALSDTPVCAVFDDNTAGQTDRRFNIIGMGGLEVDQLIAANQSAGDAGSDADEAVLSNNEVLIVEGPLTVGSQQRAANIRVFDNSQALARPAGSTTKVNFSGTNLDISRQLVMQACSPATDPDCTPATSFVADVDTLTTNDMNVDTFNNDLVATGTNFELGDGTFNDSEALNAGTFNVLGAVDIRAINGSETLPGREHLISANDLELPAASTVTAQEAYLQGVTQGLQAVTTTGASAGYGAVVNSITQTSGNVIIGGNVQAASRTDTRLNIRDQVVINSTLNIGQTGDGVTGECTGDCPIQEEPPLVLDP